MFKAMALVALLAFAHAAHAAEKYQWKRVVEVAEVAIEVRQVTPSQMRRVRKDFGHDSRGVGLAGARAHLGFAVLVRRGGEYFCTVYVLDLTDEDTLAHERRHCHGWTH